MRSSLRRKQLSVGFSAEPIFRPRILEKERETPVFAPRENGEDIIRIECPGRENLLSHWKPKMKEAPLWLLILLGAIAGVAFIFAMLAIIATLQGVPTP